MSRALLVGVSFVGAIPSGCKDKLILAPGAVQVTADKKGFTPSSVTFKKGAPASLVFLRTSDDTCATEVVFLELAIKKVLPKGQPVTVDIPTEEDQSLTFQCGMGMYKSAIVAK